MTEASASTALTRSRLIEESLPRSPPPPDDSSISQADMPYFQYLLSMPSCCPRTAQVFGMNYLFRDLEVPIQHILPLPIASKPIRYAMLAIASSRKDGPYCHETLVHMDRFILSIRQAISDASFFDFIYGNYLIFQRDLENEAPLKNLLFWLFGIAEGIRAVAKCAQNVNTEEFLWIERLWRTNYYPLLFQHLRPLRFQREVLLPVIDNICLDFEGLLPILPSSQRSPSTSSNGVLKHRPRSLEMMLYYYFIRYLMHLDANRMSPEMFENVVAPLRRLLRHILEIGCLEEFPDLFRKMGAISPTEITMNENATYTKHQLQLFSVYCFAFLLDSSLENKLNMQNYHIAISAAMVQCCISALIPATPKSMNLQMKFLFLSGLILTHSRYPRGKE